VEIKTTLTAHKVMAGTCPMSDERVKGAFPQGVTGTKQYGAGVFGFVMSLLTVGYMSEDRIKKLLTSLNVPISTGTIQSMLSRAAANSEEAEKYIKDKITGQSVVNFDETGMRVNGSLHWLHCACCGPWRLYSVQERRGEEGMDLMGVLPNFHGIAVHDFWSSYKKFKDVLHAMCCQHLERELVYAEESGNQEWAAKLRKLLQSMCHAKNIQMAEGKEAFSEEELQSYMARYDEIVAEGLKINPIPERKPGQRGRQKRGKIRCLLDRFQDCKEDILRFATDWKVPYTNNAALYELYVIRTKHKGIQSFKHLAA